MLKMMVFSINTSKYFELGCLELEKFIKHLGEPAYANLITDELKELLNTYEPDYKRDDWDIHFSNWLKSLQTGDYLCMYDGWITDYKTMNELKEKYITQLKDKGMLINC
ncbi:hypothetical protein [uncultured Brachyspira sp.]|uniref:hypothetical protein n=1 Tax=uncultured Brachyspira sp. TaxID=221953 RepID=UPI0025E98393|nr:hypothetical protein [uncultured Brachyspira sp.]